MGLPLQAEEFVTALFETHLPPVFVYHNLRHTKDVVQAVKKIAAYEEISHEDTEKLLLAAWFHDTGYVKSTTDHETLSLGFFDDFAQQFKVDATTTASVKELILATRMQHKPIGILQMALKDADYYHFSSTDYPAISENLRIEWKHACGQQATDLEWAKGNIEMMCEKHEYYTNYAREFWQPLKQQNIDRIQKKIKKMSKSSDSENQNQENKSARAEKSTDTMFKITLTNHIRLSEIADSKANILLSVNAIIISIALSSIVPKLDNPANAHLIMPTFIMVVFSVLSIVFAILSTKPKVTSGKFTRQDIEDKKVNLLFFGNFFKMPYKEYEWAVNELLKDREYLYNSMIKDLYFLGIVLERKYRLLRITYNIFMIGIIVSVISFVIAFKSTGV